MATISLSRVQVLNDAIRIVGGNLITSPTGASESARQSNAIFDRVVAQEIAKNAWYFAKVQVSLPADVSVPTYKFPYSYQLPGDFVRLVEIEDMWVFSNRQGGATPQRYYELQGTKLFTVFKAPLNLTYLVNLDDDTSTWPAYFSIVISAAIAKEIAQTLTKSESMVALATQVYKSAITDCARLNAIQQAPDEQPDNSWINARFY